MAGESQTYNSGMPCTGLEGKIRLEAELESEEPIEPGIAGRSVRKLALRYSTPGLAHWYAYRIEKCVSPHFSWLGKLSGDRLGRELRLWSGGLLGSLPADISTGVLSADERDSMSSLPCSGRLVMKDLRGYLLRDRHGRLLPPPPLTPPGGLSPLVLAILHHLARLHAAYWEDPRLDDPTLGLMDASHALLLLAPDRLATLIAEGDAAPYLPIAMAGWKAFFQLADPSDAETLVRQFHSPERVLPAIEAQPRTLLHGDVWGPNLGLIPPSRRAPRRGSSLLLLDWGLAAAGPSTYDVLWLSGTWHALNPGQLLAAYRARLSPLLSARGKRLTTPVWRGMVDAAYLRTALTCGEALARSSIEAPPGPRRRQMEARVTWWAARAAQAARRLENETSRLEKSAPSGGSRQSR